MAGFSKYNRGPGDSILALLEPGEYVLNRNAVEEVGKDNLDDLNYEDAPRFNMSQRGQFQAGGMLGDMMGYQEGDYVRDKVDLGSRMATRKEREEGMKHGFEKGVFPYFAMPRIDERISELRKDPSSIQEELATKYWDRWFDEDKTGDDSLRNVMLDYIDKYTSDSSPKMSEQDAIDYIESKAESRIGAQKLYKQSILDRIKGQQLGGILGMQGGGSTLEYGGATTEEPTLEELYKMMGMQPNVTRRPGFEEQWAYDPSREGTWFEDYGMDIQGATQAGRQNLMGAGQKMQQTQAKAGFAGSGAGAQAVSQQRGTIMQDFLAKEAAAKSSLFKGVRGEREKWMTEAGGALGTLQGAEGTVDYGAPDWAEVPADDPNWNPPSNPTGGQVYNMDGANYYWNQNTNSWETEQDYNYSTQDRDDDDEWGPSDVRLKKDINYLFTMNNGVPIYTFKYKWSDDVSIGTMAQDIEDMIPEAVSTHSSGYKMVNYSKVFSYGKI